MIRKLITSLVMFGASVGVAQANLTLTGSHTSNLQQGVIETYFIKADATGSADIFVDQDVRADDSFFNGFLSVWQLIDSNWSLVGANNDAPEVAPYLVNSYGVPIEGAAEGVPAQGQSDSGLTLALTANSTYMITQSEDLNGPSSLGVNVQALDNGIQTVPDVGYNPLNISNATQTMAVGSNYVSGFNNGALAFYDESNAPYLNNYIIQINGSVSLTPAPIAAVPLPATAWLFASALAAFTSIRRKKI